MLEVRAEEIFPKSLYVIILDGNQKKHRKYLLVQLLYPLLGKRVYLIVRRLFCQNANITAYVVWMSLVAVGLDEKLGIARRGGAGAAGVSRGGRGGSGAAGVSRGGRGGGGAAGVSRGGRGGV
uniref:Uncharacterized protein n=1 Tax=Chromera velia CCMP2878 TaxID=1169474 RepID=A0A0G4HF28_9ALVE|eukprot:Cvel_26815.t1-p1 / transcript=Cvel_26815.t1 / gene=Cvel_26815 / organism=Chromera_velia_CCMP2878 / gene_product=hypothetical protein / transcript_product=hypothetical protein / location=Cvel_scaffold3248:2298-2663(+) / protein_length=122 / sequence_SO=supercontig / SO=protein_coding / is_pseudo=false